MTLRRKAIRHAIVAALSAGVPEFGGRVFANRTEATRHTELPCAFVYSTGEAVREVSSSPVHHARSARFVVQVADDGHAQLEDTLDGLAQKVEDVLWRSEALGAAALTSSIELTAVEGPDLIEEASRVTGDVRILWDITYETDPLEAHGPADDFALLHAEFESHAPRTGPEAEADIELEVVAP